MLPRIFVDDSGQDIAEYDVVLAVIFGNCCRCDSPSARTRTLFSQMRLVRSISGVGLHARVGAENLAIGFLSRRRLELAKDTIYPILVLIRGAR